MKQYDGESFDGQWLDFPVYAEHYGERFTECCGAGWKLERKQHFIEPNNPSWRAFFLGGDWEGSLASFAMMTAEIQAEKDRISGQQGKFRRVRVVEAGKDLTAYLQWELRGLLARTKCGELINVVTPAQVAQYEQEAMLPEIVVLGSKTAYEVHYGPDHAATGAVLSTDPEVARYWTTVIERLFRAGEPLANFFAREIEGLAPPNASFDAGGHLQITPSPGRKP